MMQKQFEKAQATVAGGTLYVVATPIGNLADITLRALAVLQRADLVCAEDTRVTAQLLSAYGLSAKLLSVREHNERQMAGKVIAALAEGKVVAQVSDAGTPAVCDPGARLAAQVRAAGFAVVPVAGASAVMAALSVAGAEGQGFAFHGFLPPKSAARRTLFARWRSARETAVAFEAPHRIAAALDDMTAVLPGRRIMLAREISKTFETFLTGTVEDVRRRVAEDADQCRGEMVLVLYPDEAAARAEEADEGERVMRILAGHLPTKQAAELAAEISGGSKKALYQLALSWKD